MELSDTAVDESSLIAHLSEMEAVLWSNIPTEDEATAAAITAGNAAFTKVTDKVNSVEAVFPPVGEEEATADVDNAAIGGISAEAGDEEDSKPAVLESTIDENVAAHAVVGLHGILKRTGKKGD